MNDEPDEKSVRCPTPEWMNHDTSPFSSRSRSRQLLQPAMVSSCRIHVLMVPDVGVRNLGMSALYSRTESRPKCAAPPESPFTISTFSALSGDGSPPSPSNESTTHSGCPTSFFATFFGPPAQM